MAQQIEAQGNAFLARCKGYGIILTAVTGLALGILNHFREVRDPRVKTSYEEVARVSEGVSKDIRALADTVRQQQEAINNIQNYLLSEKRTPTQPPTPKTKLKPPAKMELRAPPIRRPMKWDKLTQQGL